MLLAGLLPFALAQAADVTSAMLEKADQDAKNVPSSGIGSQGQRDSPLTRADTRTVAQLTPFAQGRQGGAGQRTEAGMRTGAEAIILAAAVRGGDDRLRVGAGA
jgi:hypothetical protein